MFDTIKSRPRSITPTFQPKCQKATPTSAKHTTLNNPCTTCPAILQRNSLSLKHTTPVSAPKTNVVLISNTIIPPRQIN